MKKRLYAPFVKVGKRWIRVKDSNAYYKETAVRVYQNWLLEPFLTGVNEMRELRPIPHPKRDEAAYEFNY